MANMPRPARLPMRRGPSALVPAVFQVTVYRSPFRLDALIARVPVGQSLQDAVAHHLPPALQGAVVVWLNDQVVPADAWARVRPKAQTRVTLRVYPRGGLVRSLLMVGVAIAALAAASFFPPALGLLPGTFAFSAVAAGSALTVGIVGSLLVNALVPVRPPALAAASAGNPAVRGGGRPEASPTFSITAPRNDLRPWGPIPVVFGRHRQTPPYGAAPYTEIVDNEQYIRAVFVWGYGPLQISDIRLGDTPITEFADVTIETREGWPGDPPLTLVTQPVFEESLSIQLFARDGFHIRTTRNDIDEFSFDIFLPQGLAQLSTDGSLMTSRVNIQADFRRVGTEPWIPIVLPGVEHQIPGGGFQATSAWEGTPGSSDPSSRGVRIWLNTQTLLLEMAETGPQPFGGEVPPPIPDYARSIARYAVSGDNLTRVVQELHPDLMGFLFTNPSGRLIDVGPGTYFATGSNFGAASQTAIRFTPPTGPVQRGQYEIRIRRVTPDTEEPSIHNAVYWATLRSRRYTPVLAFDQPLAVTAVRIRASAQLNGPLDTLNGLCESLLPDWDAETSTWITRPTVAAASMFRAILQGPASPTPLSDAELDLPSLQTWATYGINKGVFFSMVRDFRASVWDTLLDVCSAGRATIVLREGQWGVVIDELGVGSPPVQHFSPRNSWDFRAEKPYRRMPHAFRIRYLNEAQNFRQDEAFVYQDGYGPATATVFEQLELPGQTSLAAVTKQGRFHLAQALLRPESYSFATDWEYLRCHRGDRIRVSHDVPLWGVAAGRVIAVDDPLITLDTKVTMRPNQGYSVRVRRADGTSLLRAVHAVASETDQLTLAGTGDLPAVGDLVLFGETGRETVSLVVHRIEPLSDLSARLHCFDEAPAIHVADAGPMAPYDPQITLPVDFQLIRNGGFDALEVWGLHDASQSLWVVDDPSAMTIEASDDRRSGRQALRLTPAATEAWARPNSNLPVGIPFGQRLYAEAWAKGGTGSARLALGWYTPDFYLFHAVMGQPVLVSGDYTRLVVDAFPPATTRFVHFQVGTTGQTSGDTWIDDVLAFGYTLPVVEASTVSAENNYLRMEDQTGAIWHLSALEGWLALDEALTLGTQANPGATWAWIALNSPDNTPWYLFPAPDGTLVLDTIQPTNGIGFALFGPLLDKRTWQPWDIAVLDEGIYQLVEAA